MSGAKLVAAAAGAILLGAGCASPLAAASGARSASAAATGARPAEGSGAGGRGPGGETPAAPHPPGRAGAAMGYDPAHSVVVLFGGSSAAGGVLGDTWTWDGSRWSRRDPAHSPSARSGAAVAFDGQAAALILFGGRDGSGRALADTWRWDGDDWIELHPRTAPPARAGAALAYDASVGRLVLYGGGTLHDTWTWGGDEWSPVAAAGPSVDGGVLAYDPRQGRVLLVSATQTWGFLAGGWSNLTAAPPPNCAPAGGIEDGEVAAPVVVSGDGAAVGVCEWGDGGWKPLPAPGAPPGRATTQVAFDDKTSELVLFGGATAAGEALDDTWTWTPGRGWSQG